MKYVYYYYLSDESSRDDFLKICDNIQKKHPDFEKKYDYYIGMFGEILIANFKHDDDNIKLVSDGDFDCVYIESTIQFDEYADKRYIPHEADINQPGYNPRY